MSEIIFRVNPTELEGKQGKLPRNDKGHFKVLVGMYNAYNTCGDKYIFTQRVRNLFTHSRAARRCKEKRLYGEADHPELRDFISRTRTQEEAVALYLDRLCIVPPDKQAHQIWDFWFEELPHKVDGETVYGVYTWLDPFHPRQRASLENPEENTSYSVRSFIDRTPSRTMGSWIYETKEINTWDWVTNPGMNKVGKYNTAGLESEKRIAYSDTLDVLVNDGVFHELQKLADQRQAMSQGLESEDHVMLTSMVKDIAGWREVPNIGATLARQWVLGK